MSNLIEYQKIPKPVPPPTSYNPGDIVEYNGETCIVVQQEMYYGSLRYVTNDSPPRIYPAGLAIVNLSNGKPSTWDKTVNPAGVKLIARNPKITITYEEI